MNPCACGCGLVGPKTWRPGHHRRGLSGPLSGQWKGDAAGQQAGRMRCQALYPAPLGMCEREGCQSDAHDRHHINGNTLDNDRSNVAFLCTFHHLAVDAHKRMSESAKQKRSAKMRGRPLTPAHREAIRQSLLGRILSPEWRAKIGLANKAARQRKSA